MGGGGPEAFEEVAAKVKQAWSDAGRDGAPRLTALCYFALGDDAREAADRYTHDYYAFIREVADQLAQGVAVDEGMATQYRDAFAAAGADELIYFPCSPDPAQVDLLADALE